MINVPDVYFNGCVVQENWLVAQRCGETDEGKKRQTEERRKNVGEMT